MPTAKPMNRDEAVREIERIAEAIRCGRADRSDSLRLIAALTALRSGGGEAMRTGVFDKNDREICAGDRVVFRNEGPYTNPEYWNPEYVVEWKAPAFVLRHVGGGKGSDTAHHGFVLAGKDQSWANNFEVLAPHPQPARGEAVAWARQSGDPNDDAFVISAKVKRLWLASNPKRVARYTRPLYTTHVPCWALPAVESALSMLDLQGYWHSDLAAFRDWLKEKSQ